MPDTIPAAEIAARLDLRDRPFITIDPASARDHDDAIAVESAGRGGARLWVAIADVAHFVRPGSALDREAWRRGNSVYFPGRAIPMLPERLSGELCSLVPDVDRLVLVVEMKIGSNGAIADARFHRAVIRSRARLSYEQAARFMEPAAEASSEGPPPAATPDPPILSEEVRQQLPRLGELAKKLMAKRSAEGSLDFELPEAEIVLDARGRVVNVTRSRRTLAHRAVEEAMLAANRSVARALSAGRYPAVFRLHEAPTPDDLEKLAAVYRGLGLHEGAPGSSGGGGGRRGGGGGSGGAPLNAAAMNRALRRSAGRPHEPFVHLVTLRAMRQARYSAVDGGHFALGFESYLHFTSPIRRYADLLTHRAVHRLIGDSLSGARARKPADDTGARALMERAAIRTSARERIAMAAEREMIDLKKCAFMRPHLGREMMGVVTGVASQGLYVTLEDFFVQGLVRIADLPGYFDFDEASHSLVARRSGHRHCLGDRLRVRVAAVDQVKGWINFTLASGRKRRGKGSVAGGRGGERGGEHGGARGGEHRGGRDGERGEEGERAVSPRRSGPRVRRSGAPTRRSGRRSPS